MQKTWGNFKLEIARIVNDPQLTKFSADLLYCVNDALLLLATSHTGIASVSIYTGDGETTDFPIPSNAASGHKGARIRGVYDSTNDEWLSEVDVLPGKKRQEGWLVWPNGYLGINPAPATDNEIHMYYVACYDEIVDDNSVLPLPSWAFEAVKLYTAGRVLQTQIAQLTLLANFRTKVDSGTPEHNPMLRLAEYYIAQFWEILNQNPAPQLEKIVTR